MGYIELTGQIQAGDLEKLQRILKIAKRPKINSDNAIVSLHSPGGDVVVAAKIGEALRKDNALTLVDNGAECSSACIYVLAGGAIRFVRSQAKLGLHRPYYDKKYFAQLSSDEARTAYNKFVNASRAYFDAMGIYPSLFNDMLKIPSGEMQYVSSEYAKSVNLEGQDPGYMEWERAKKEQEFGPRKMKAVDDYLKCLSTGTSQDICMEKYGKILFQNP